MLSLAFDCIRDGQNEPEFIVDKNAISTAMQVNATREIQLKEIDKRRFKEAAAKLLGIRFQKSK